MQAAHYFYQLGALSMSETSPIHSSAMYFPLMYGLADKGREGGGVYGEAKWKKVRNWWRRISCGSVCV